MTMALAPASSRRRKLSRSLVKGPAEATSGLFSCNPRYLVERSGMGRLLRGLRLRAAILRGARFVQLPALLHLGLGFLQQTLGGFRLAVLEHRIARLVVNVFFERQGGRLRIQYERVLAFLGQIRIVAEQNPVPGVY